MTQEDKKLLLKDLSARIAYGLKASVRGSEEENIAFDILSVTANFRVFVKNLYIGIRHFEDIDAVIPYLCSMSSMTEEEHNELFNTYHSAEMKEVESSGDYLKASMVGDITKYDWLNAHHFDYRGLIPKGLAIEAPKGMYNIKN